MSKLLYISASPRGDDSASIQAARIFIDTLPDAIDVTHLDLSTLPMPDVTANVCSAKSKFMMGQELNAEEASEWKTVTQFVDTFLAADHYLIAVPMWNFSVPYTMKQYIDLITHPGLTFAADDKGMRGLASGDVTVIYARGGDYSPKNGEPDPFDFQSTYLKGWFTLVGLSPVNEVLVQRTMAGPDAQADAVEGARAQLERLAQSIGD